MLATVLFVATPDWYISSHRIELAEYLQASGWMVSIAAPRSDKPRSEKLLQFSVHDIVLDRDFNSLRGEIRALLDLRSLFKRLRPDIVHLFSPKAVVLGGIIARLTRTPAVLSPGGLGTAFLGHGKRASLERAVIRFGIRFALSSNRARIILQNPKEVAELVGHDQRGKVVSIGGCGIDTASFAVRPADQLSSPVVTMASRLLKTKGIKEFAQAAALVRKKFPNARFQVVGALDEGNKNGLSNSDMVALQSRYGIEWNGHVGDIRTCLRDSWIAVLPSYSEGLSRFLIEAAAAARPIVATDIPGNRIIVHEGVNGLLVPVADGVALGSAILRLLRDESMRVSMGAAGPRIARGFDIAVIGEKTERLYREICDA